MNESRKVDGLAWSSGKNFFTFREESMKIRRKSGMIIHKVFSLFKMENSGFTPLIQTCSSSIHARDNSGSCYLEGLKAIVLPLNKKNKRSTPSRH